VGCDAPSTLSSTTFLLQTAVLLQTAPFEQLQLRQPTFENESIRPILQTARQEATALKDAEAELSMDFDLTLGAGTYTPTQLLEYAAVLDEASLWQRFFGGNYRRATRVHRRIALGKKKTPRQNMSRALRGVAEYVQRRAKFENHATYRQMFGMYFQGVNSPWEHWHELLLWYEQVLVALPEHQPDSEPFRRLMFDARTERLKAIKVSLGSVQEHHSALNVIVSRVADFTRAVPSQRSLMVSGSFDEILDRLQKLTHELCGVIEILDRVALHDDAPCGMCRAF
jgi:hypothetical protein